MRNQIVLEDVNMLFFNHADTPSGVDRYNLEMAVAFVDASVKVTGQSAFIIDFDEHKILYRTDYLLYIDEARHSDVKRVCANPYWSLVSDDVLSMLLQIRSDYTVLNTVLSRDEYSKHICVIDYPINIRGHQLFVTQKFIPLMLRPDGITKIGMFTIGHSNKTSVECLVIASGGRRFRYDLKIGDSWNSTWTRRCPVQRSPSFSERRWA